MGKKEPAPIADILSTLKGTEEYGKHFEVGKIWRHWGEVVGERLLPHGRPLGVREETLYVEVSSAVWMHRYSYYKWEILARMSRIVRGLRVSEIFFVLADEGTEANPQDDV